LAPQTCSVLDEGLNGTSNTASRHRHLGQEHVSACAWMAGEIADLTIEIMRAIANRMSLTIHLHEKESMAGKEKRANSDGAL